MTVTMFRFLILILRFHFTIFSSYIFSIEKIYQTRKIVFYHISKHLEVRQKYSAAHRMFQLSSRCLQMWSNTIFRV